MLYKMFSIRDNKLGTFTNPFTEKTSVHACRGFHVALNDPKMQLSFFPQEFDLYEVAEFNDETGQYTNCPQPVFIASGTSLKGQERFEVKKNEQN